MGNDLSISIDKLSITSTISSSENAQNSTPELEPIHEPESETKAETREEEKSRIRSRRLIRESGLGKEVVVEEEQATCGVRLFWKDKRFKDIAKKELKNCLEECAEKGGVLYDDDDDDLDEAEREARQRSALMEAAGKCFNVSTLLKRCMRADPEYCGPLLLAEKAELRLEEAATEAARKK